MAPFSNSASVDVWAVYLTGIATLLLLAIPFIPGLRDIPRYIPGHRLIWRSTGRAVPESGSGANQVGATTADKSPA